VSGKSAGRSLTHERVETLGVNEDATMTSMWHSDLKSEAQSDCYMDCPVVQVEAA